VKQPQQLWQQRLLQMLPLLLPASHVSRQGMRFTPRGPVLLGQGCWQLHSQSLLQRQQGRVMLSMGVDLPPVVLLGKGKVTKVQQRSKAAVATRVAATAGTKSSAAEGAATGSAAGASSETSAAVDSAGHKAISEGKKGSAVGDTGGSNSKSRAGGSHKSASGRRGPAPGDSSKQQQQQWVIKPGSAG